MSRANSVLTPNEKITGSGEQRADILTRLARFRSDPRRTLRLSEKYPALTFTTLDALLPTLDSLDLAVFEAGVELASARLASLGLRAMLPTSRVFVGIRSTERAIGGFHHRLLPERAPDDTQSPGYRYVQAAAVTTKYGSLGDDAAHIPAPGLVGLDLIRSYTHDSLHWGTFRSYRLGADGIHRQQHGINFRRENGATYSARDSDGATSTRNLGIVMEGAFDREATRIAGSAAAVIGLACPPGGIDYYAFCEATGDYVASPGEDAWLSGMNGYNRSVNAPYAAFLAEIAGFDKRDLHELIIRATLDGDLDPLQRWLDERYGPGEYTALFRSSAYVPA